MEQQQHGQGAVVIVQEMDLGQHTLFLLSDGGMQLLANDEETPYLADNALALDSDETYRLFITLHEQFEWKAKLTMIDPQPWGVPAVQAVNAPQATM